MEEISLGAAAKAPGEHQEKEMPRAAELRSGLPAFTGVPDWQQGVGRFGELSAPPRRSRMCP